MLNPDLQTTYQEAEELADRREVMRRHEVVAVGKRIFDGTGIVDPSQPIDGRSVVAMRQFLREAAPGSLTWPETGRNWAEPRGPLEHMQMTAAIAKYTAEQMRQLPGYGAVNPDLQEVVGLGHDLGRFVHHRFYETDLLTEQLRDEIGFVPQIGEAEHDIHWYWDTDQPITLPTIPQRISVFADVLAKRSSVDSSRLRRPHEVVREVQIGKQKYLQQPVRTQYDQQMHERIGDYGERERRVLTAVVGWIDHLGINMQPCLEQIDEEMRAGKYLKPL